ncbi:hypothetical protein Tco_1328892 [Tanacetum coccineum]
MLQSPPVRRALSQGSRCNILRGCGFCDEVQILFPELIFAFPRESRLSGVPSLLSLLILDIILQVFHESCSGPVIRAISRHQANTQGIGMIHRRLAVLKYSRGERIRWLVRLEDIMDEYATMHVQMLCHSYYSSDARDALISELHVRRSQESEGDSRVVGIRNKRQVSVD